MFKLLSYLRDFFLDNCSLLIFTYTYLFWEDAYAIACLWSSEDNLRELVLSLYQYESWG